MKIVETVVCAIVMYFCKVMSLGIKEGDCSVFSNQCPKICPQSFIKYNSRHCLLKVKVAVN